jgi:2-polyprenyl-3-methyl-5-hydroxy-6-metoxy-1,4-benzoquinol methylase
MTAAEKPPEPARCWVCDSPRLARWRDATTVGPLTSADFRITDAHYGRTAAIERCADCGFRQCAELADALRYYETLDDPGYEESAGERARQMADLLALLRRFKPAGRLLDIGAGSGILLAEAQRLGYAAEGVEPSHWLAERAAAKGLTVHWGTLPHAGLRPPYDAALLIDVIEHVADPLGLLAQARDVLAPDGVGLVVTPDIDSFAARRLGARWWHCRVAHIGYFNRSTLLRALDRAGLTPLHVMRPRWHFSTAYLAQRLPVYVPFLRRWNPLARLPEVIVPLNFFDSLGVVFCKK